MPFIGSGHWVYIVILLVIVLIIFGPGKLPEIGGAMGKAIREFKQHTNDARDQVIGAATTGQPTPPPGQTAYIQPPVSPAPAAHEAPPAPAPTVAGTAGENRPPVS